MTERALLQELGRDVASLFNHAPNPQISLRSDGRIGFPGEAGAADLNMAAIYTPELKAAGHWILCAS